MRPVLILLAVFILGLLACSYASAGDCYGGRCPAISRAVVAVPVVAVATVVHDVAEHRPVRTWVAEHKPVRRTLRLAGRIVARPFRGCFR